MAESKQRRTDYEALLNKNQNKGLIILILSIIAGYVFFLLSPLLFHETPEKTLTKLNTDVGFANGRVQVTEWVYSKKQNLMEVCCNTVGISLKETEFEASCNYTYRSKGSSALKAELVYSTNDYFALHIYGVPEDWYCVSVRGTQITKAGVVDTTAENDYVSESDNVSYGYIYTCVDDVEKVDHIDKDKTEEQYTIEKTKRSIAYDEVTIESNLSKISQLQDEIKDIEDDIKSIKNEKAFQIESERNKSDSKISVLENDIENLSKQITQLETENAELKKEISDYKTVIWMLGG